LTETTNTEIKTCIQRRHLAHALPWSSSTGSGGAMHRNAWSSSPECATFDGAIIPVTMIRSLGLLVERFSGAPREHRGIAFEEHPVANINEKILWAAGYKRAAKTLRPSCGYTRSCTSADGKA
jgi:hypothetical protein